MSYFCSYLCLTCEHLIIISIICCSLNNVFKLLSFFFVIVIPLDIYSWILVLFSIYGESDITILSFHMYNNIACNTSFVNKDHIRKCMWEKWRNLKILKRLGLTINIFQRNLLVSVSIQRHFIYVSENIDCSKKYILKRNFNPYSFN